MAMNRKEFIESQGATCDNWAWSWSFVNHDDKVVIFGAWDSHTRGNTTRIFSEDWRISSKGRKQNGYQQSQDHIRLVESENYALRTFPMEMSDDRHDDDGVGPAKIEGFTPELSDRLLRRVGRDWFASDGQNSSYIPEEVDEGEQYIEGASTSVMINRYERNAEARLLCLAHHGFACSVCEFTFEEKYGSIGENFIHVHHIVPLSEIGEEYTVDPIKDLVPVCPNCHAMIHLTRPALSTSQLRAHLSQLD